MPSPAPLHDQPTQVVQALPPDHEPAPGAPPAPGRRGVGRLAALLLPLLTALLLPLAAVLLLAPAREIVLILGADARPDEVRRGESGRTDTLLALVADRATPRVAMLSVPRDLWVPIPGHGEERVNAAYQLGGAQAATQAVGAVLGLRIDRYALVGLQGVRDIVDAVGGVDITVEQAIHDPAYPTDDYGVVEVDIPAGRQHLDGETALRYARTRHQDSDFGRAARQQRVLAAVRAALLQPANWPRIPAVVAAVQRSVQTDLTPLDLVAVGAALLRDPGEPDRLVIDTTLVEPFVGQGGAYLLSPGPELRGAVARFLGDPTATVEVLNGASIAGIARATAERLSQQGFEIAHVGNADQPLGRTMVAARPEARGSADAVARALGLPVGRVSDAPDLPAGVDVRVVVGSDLAR